MRFELNVDQIVAGSAVAVDQVRMRVIEKSSRQIAVEHSCSGEERSVAVELDVSQSSSAAYRIRVDLRIQGMWLENYVSANVQSLFTCIRPDQWSSRVQSDPHAMGQIIEGFQFLGCLRAGDLVQKWRNVYRRTAVRVRTGEASPVELATYIQVWDSYQRDAAFDRLAPVPNTLYTLAFLSRVALGAALDRGHNLPAFDRETARSLGVQSRSAVLSQHFSASQLKSGIPAALAANGFAAYGLGRVDHARRILNASWTEHSDVLDEIGLFTRTGAKSLVDVALYGELPDIEPPLMVGAATGVPSEEPTIVYSGNVDFLKKYLGRIAFQAINVSDIAYHFHVIELQKGDGQQFERLLLLAVQSLGEISGKSVDTARFSVSTESLPAWVQDWKTYCACSRYVHAEWFLDNVSRRIWIQDADSFLDSNPAGWLTRYDAYDVTLTTAGPVDSIVPWREFLAYSTYLVDSATARAFAGAVRKVCVAGLTLSDMWMLDQTALSVAYKNVREQSNGNRFLSVGENSHPLRHHLGSMNSLIERPRP